MRIHAIQTGTVAVKTRQRAGVGHGLRRRVLTLANAAWTEPLPIYAWLIEHPEGLIVVDTGETARATEPGYFPSWHPYFRFGVREWVRPEEEIGPQLRRLGVNPADIRWVVLTHLHTDHAGGLHHFPHATILVSAEEHRVAQGWPGQVRGYLPNRWPEWFAPQPVAFEEAPFGPFVRSARLTQAGDIVLVPTAGRTAGHLSVIVRDQGHDVFLAGDASYTEELMLRQRVDGVAPDELAARQTLRNILALAAASPLVYLPSHDPQAAQRLALRQTAALPAVSA